MSNITRPHETMVALNEALVISALHQHELTEASELLNFTLQEEIAERKLAEAALRVSETRLRALNTDLERKVLEGSRKLGRSNLTDAIESLDHCLVLYDRDDRLVLFNHKLSDQYPFAERYFVIGRTFEAIFRDLVESGAENVPTGETKEQFTVDRLAHHQRADGAIMEIAQVGGRILHVSEHRSQSGGCVSIGRDVTQELKLAEQLREAQKMDAIGRLTGGLAHDLNNYLSVIIGNLDELADWPHGDAAMQKRIDGAIGGALRGAELTRSLLAFSRRQPLHPKVIDVGARIAGVAKMLKRTIGENIVIGVHMADDLWPVKIDAAQLDTCVVNLANNARDAMPSGGRLSITLSNVSSRDEKATNGDDLPGDSLLIEFADSGSGMNRETLARVFEPFFTTKGPGHGTGLGLSMVHGFVHQSGGTVRVMSRPGEGTDIRIYLPRSLETGTLRMGPPVAQSMPRGHERILLVEDNEHVRATVYQQLKSLGYAVIAVESGDAAVTLLEKNASQFDLVFSDIVMPGLLNGMAVADLVAKRWPILRVLLASGYSDDSRDKSEERETGFTILRKPYRKTELACAVRDILANPK